MIHIKLPTPPQNSAIFAKIPNICKDIAKDLAYPGRKLYRKPAANPIILIL